MYTVAGLYNIICGMLLGHNICSDTMQIRVTRRIFFYFTDPLVKNNGTIEIDHSPTEPSYSNTVDVYNSILDTDRSLLSILQNTTLVSLILLCENLMDLNNDENKISIMIVV